jgi:hypothetical protein
MYPRVTKSSLTIKAAWVVKKFLVPEYRVKKRTKLISFNLIGFLLVFADLFKIKNQRIISKCIRLYECLSPYLWSVY